MENNKKYYLGLDIGTDSVGYAVTDEAYKLLKFKGEPMWGVTTFKAASQAAERRSFRTSRRRLDRRQTRVQLVRELFAEEIAKTDPEFFARLNNSSLLREEAGSEYILFNDPEYTDVNYYRQYPTIHHLINELMNSSEPHDVRLVYLACAWLVAHRGHFLSEVDKNHIADVRKFEVPYKALMDFFEEETPWTCDDLEAFSEILQKKVSSTQKSKELISFLWNAKKAPEEESFSYSREGLVYLLCGRKYALDKLFKNSAYTSDNLTNASVSLGMKDEDLETLYAEIGDDADLIRNLKAVYDWTILADILPEDGSLSSAKVEIYQQHARDLKALKAFVKKYLPGKYDEVFRVATKNGYAHYTKHLQECGDLSGLGQNTTTKASKEDFSKYLLKLVKTVKPQAADLAFYQDMVTRLEQQTFLPKQVDSDNRVIPYQVYWNEMRTLLARAEGYLPFLKEQDGDGLTVSEKLLSIMEFRVPYYVGPLNAKSDHAWIHRRGSEKIYPWNFEEVVDLDASEEAFIQKLTNTCTYYPEEKVLPKNSPTYARYMVLNEINNLKIDGQKIPVALKQQLFNELFMHRKKVTVRSVHNFLINNGVITAGETSRVSGIDVTIKASMQPALAFSRLRRKGLLSDEDVERIVLRITCTEDKTRLRQWLRAEFPRLPEEEIRYVAGLKYSDFGRLSGKFLCGLYGCEKESGTGEAFTIMDGLWNTNCNLMELLSNRFTFREQLDALRQKYYGEHPQTLTDRMAAMWVPNAVKRPIFRTLDIVSDVVKAMGCAPQKIFVEMARDMDASQKGTRTKTRKQQLLELYQLINSEDTRNLAKEIEDMGDSADNRLQSDKLFLYYTQLGRCMYSGKAIDLEALMAGDGTYNIDHIYPQAYVKDDSVLNNKVLVLSSINGDKDDIYPIPSDIRDKMAGTWQYMQKNGLITDEKYKRLTRTAPFSDEEKMNFINRQLVETRQSTKAVATLLGEKYPDAKVVYVKAGLVSDFRHEFDMIKSRAVNDLHHAKDAYLNIVVGNVYHEKFTDAWFHTDQQYSIKTRTIFTHPAKAGSKCIWHGQEDLDLVRRTIGKNAVHFTRYAFCSGGGLFDQMPVRAGEGLVQLKEGKPTEIYGGYNKPAAAFFALVRFSSKGKTDAMVMPVELRFAERFRSDPAFRVEYSINTVSAIRNKPVESVEFPLGDRVLKINTMLSLDGLRCCVTGKSSGGSKLILMPMMPLSVGASMEKYIKHIESFVAKLEKNPKLMYDARYDKVTKEDNLRLYDLLHAKLQNSVYKNRPANPANTMEKGRNAFTKLEVAEQCKCLMQLLQVFGRMSGGCDLTAIGGVKTACATGGFSAVVSNWKKTYQDVRIIDSSASGLYETSSDNLLDMI